MNARKAIKGLYHRYPMGFDTAITVIAIAVLFAVLTLFLQSCDRRAESSPLPAVSETVPLSFDAPVYMWTAPKSHDLLEAIEIRLTVTGWAEVEHYWSGESPLFTMPYWDAVAWHGLSFPLSVTKFNAGTCEVMYSQHADPDNSVKRHTSVTDVRSMWIRGDLAWHQNNDWVLCVQGSTGIWWIGPGWFYAGGGGEVTIEVFYHYLGGPPSAVRLRDRRRTFTDSLLEEYMGGTGETVSFGAEVDGR